MKKYYICTLVQVSEEQGYIGKRQKQITSETEDIILGRSEALNNFNSRTIIVEKTLNPNILREVITGLPIPVLRVKTWVKQLHYIYSPSYLVGSDIHTFVPIISQTTYYVEETRRNSSGLYKVDDFHTLKQYLLLHPDSEIYKQELLAYFEQGRIKMQNRLKIEEAKPELMTKQTDFETWLKDRERYNKSEISRMQRELRRH